MSLFVKNLRQPHPIKSVSTNMPSSKPFLEAHTTAELRVEAERVMAKHKGRIPVVCTLAKNCSFTLDKTKYLVPLDLTIGQLSYVIRKRTSIKPEQAIFLMCGDMFPAMSTTMGELYDQYADEETLFLIVRISLENTFG